MVKNEQNQRRLGKKNIRSSQRIGSFGIQSLITS
jgi:hypothetical protein